MTYLWWAIDSGMIRIGRWFKRVRAGREASLFHDWDTELAEAEAERESWEPNELWAFERRGSSRGGGASVVTSAQPSLDYLNGL